MKLVTHQVIPDFQMHYGTKFGCIGSQRLKVYSVDNRDSKQFLGKIPASLLRQQALRVELGARLLRGGVHAVLPFEVENESNAWLAIAERQIFILSDHNEVYSLFSIPRGRRPLRRGWCVIAENVFIGEYWGNSERTAVNIYKIHVPTGQVDTFHQFPAQTVRHVHTVDKDPYSDQLWVSTGDEDNECQIVVLNATTGEEMLIGAGAQKWRTVSFAFRPNSVYWGTDNHLGDNEIWRYDRVTQQVIKIGDVVGPVYYNCCLDNGIVFGTTMEKGEGQQDGYGRLYAVDHNDVIHEVWKVKKDRWSAHYFGYGVFEFAEGSAGENKFWVTAKGFKGGLRSILFELKND